MQYDKENRNGEDFDRDMEGEEEGPFEGESGDIDDLLEDF